VFLDLILTVASSHKDKHYILHFIVIYWLNFSIYTILELL